MSHATARARAEMLNTQSTRSLMIDGLTMRFCMQSVPLYSPNKLYRTNFTSPRSRLCSCLLCFTKMLQSMYPMYRTYINTANTNRINIGPKPAHIQALQEVIVRNRFSTTQLTRISMYKLVAFLDTVRLLSYSDQSQINSNNMILQRRPLYFYGTRIAVFMVYTVTSRVMTLGGTQTRPRKKESQSTLLAFEYVCTATLHKQVIWITQGKSNSAVISSTLVQVFGTKEAQASPKES